MTVLLRSAENIPKDIYEASVEHRKMGDELAGKSQLAIEEAVTFLDHVIKKLSLLIGP